MYGSDAVDGSPQRHRNVPKRNRDSLITGVILAFAERLFLANNGHERAYRLRPLYPRKRTFQLVPSMSVNSQQQPFSKS